MTIDEVWIDDRIYWTSFNIARDYNFTIHYYTHTSVHIHVFINRCLIAALTADLPLLWVPELSQASNISFSQHMLTTTEPQWTSNLLTRRPTPHCTHLKSIKLTSVHFSNYPAYISTQTAQKPPLLCCSIHLLPWKHACLWSRYLVRVVVYLLIS